MRGENKMLFYGSLSNFIFDEVNKKNLLSNIYSIKCMGKHTGSESDREKERDREREESEGRLIISFYSIYDAL